MALALSEQEVDGKRTIETEGSKWQVGKLEIKILDTN